MIFTAKSAEFLRWAEEKERNIPQNIDGISVNIHNINNVKNILYPILVKLNDMSEKLFKREKNNKFEKIMAIRKVNQSEAIVVFTLLFLT